MSKTNDCSLSPLPSDSLFRDVFTCEGVGIVAFLWKRREEGERERQTREIEPVNEKLFRDQIGWMVHFFTRYWSSLNDDRWGILVWIDYS